MKRYILAVLAASSMAVSAQAADLGSYKDAPSTAPELVRYQSNGFSWSGFYVTGLIGHSSVDADVDHSGGYGYGIDYADPRYDYLDYAETFQFEPSSASFDLDGFIGGAEFSYKYKTGALIFEPFVNATVGGGDVHRSEDNGWTGYEFSLDKNWDGMLGLKVGGLLTERLYVYGLFGGTLASFDVDFKHDTVGYPGTSYNDTKYLFGGTVGAGAQYAVTDKVLAGVVATYTWYPDADIDLKKTVETDYQYVVYSASTEDHISIDPEEFKIMGTLSIKID
jgi:opacity protein-like surface antigen